jgi:tetratricopeptide (TPR) repeat protein
MKTFFYLLLLLVVIFIGCSKVFNSNKTNKNKSTDTIVKLNFSQNIEELNKRIQNNPNDAEAYYSRAAFNIFKSIDSAIADYTKAIEIKPDYTEAYVGRGDLYWNSKNNDKAIADYNKALEIDSNLQEAYSGRGFAYFYSKNYDKAKFDFSKAIEFMSNDSTIYVSEEKKYFIYYCSGWAKVATEDYKNAISDITVAITIFPNDTNAYLTRGDIYLILNNKDKACEDYKKAASFGSFDAKVYLEKNCK